MSRKRPAEPAALHHLIEPINPYSAPLTHDDTPGLIARLLEDYHRHGSTQGRTAHRTLPRVRSTFPAHDTASSRGPVSPMDALAATALGRDPSYSASVPGRQPGRSPVQPQRWAHTQLNGMVTGYSMDGYDGPPPKRARSEALPPSVAYQETLRPTTSHIPPFGGQYHVESGIQNAEKKRQLSLAEQDVLEFMEQLGSKRREGNPSPWPEDHKSPTSLHVASYAHMNGNAPVAAQAQTVVNAYGGMAPVVGNVADYGVQAVQVHQDQPLVGSTAINGSNASSSSPSHAMQTHTPPEEKPTISAPLDSIVDSAESTYTKSERRTSGTVSNIQRAMGKRKESYKGGQTLDGIHQLESPQSLHVEYPGGPSTDIILQDAEGHQSLEIAFPGLLSRPRSALGQNESGIKTEPDASSERRSASVPPTTHMLITPKTLEPAPIRRKPGRPPNLQKFQTNTVCASCNFSPNALAGETESWLQCNGCKNWYHFACAGFKNDREVRSIDKFHCKTCTPKFGKTTHVRKSARAHNSVDYAKLTEGIVQTADDTPEHHYIKPIKDGEIDFTPENFARMPAELITAEYFQKCRAMTEPIVIPAAMNPRPSFPGPGEAYDSQQSPSPAGPAGVDIGDDATARHDRVADLGQDGIGMVIPQGLTVRRVAELYGPHERLAVIDVKSQEGEDKRWTLAKWADYYEDESEDKPVRNVISLEVSRSRLGRLIRRPQVVRDLDLADSVWPREDGPPPKVQFYVLMSVADCYTDFHIDFGGSSVYYHILKGKKTFFFIPPTPANLKHYENWCKSQAQNYCWLGNQTKECYRVDLSEGDTMLIPSGWIHAVWTPETSLVIGGNFLTRLHYTNQIRVAEIEKSTKVALKFRYPFFQKVMWCTVLQYLDQDPLPPSVEALLAEGSQFYRETAIYLEYNKFGHNSDLGVEHYNARYYPQAELEGLPDLVSYIFRTVMIQHGLVEGVTQEARAAVTRSIPRKTESLENARKFAMWVAWKRGNEHIPEWAHPEAVLPDRPEADDKAKKLSVAALKKLERAKHVEMYHTINADHRSRRSANVSRPTSPGPNGGTRVPYASPKNSVLGPKRSACDACRRRRVGCKHKDAVRDASMVNGQRQFEFVAPTGKSSPPGREEGFDAMALDPALEEALEGLNRMPRTFDSVQVPAPPPPPPPVAEVMSIPDSIFEMASQAAPMIATSTPLGLSASRNKACANCRKSKRKCLHDENGNLDPVKVAESKLPRPPSKKHPAPGGAASSSKKVKAESSAAADNVFDPGFINVNGVGPSPYYEHQGQAPAANAVAMTNGSTIGAAEHLYPDLHDGQGRMIEGFGGDVDMQDQPLPAFDNFGHPLNLPDLDVPQDAASPVELIGQPDSAQLLVNGSDHQDMLIDPGLDAATIIREDADPNLVERVESTPAAYEPTETSPVTPSRIHKTIEGLHGTVSASPVTKKASLPNVRTRGGSAKKPQPAATPASSGVTRRISNSKSKSKSKSKSPEALRKRTPSAQQPRRSISAAAAAAAAMAAAVHEQGEEEEEDESLRLARELQGMEFGLRTRRG